MWNKTNATDILGIKYPIIQGPFGGRFSSAKLLSSVSNLGGMGSFGLNSYPPEEILIVDKEIKAQTEYPYALNLWVPLKDDPMDYFSDSDFNLLKATFKPYFDKMRVPLPDKAVSRAQVFELQMESILKAAPPVASFIYGIPSNEIIGELKKRNIITMATATTLEEAVLIEEAGIDLVIASGSEAGGHRASFIKSAEDSLTSTRVLIHEVVSSVTIPVVAAGGISNGRDVAEALKLGASAVQMGTAFLATNESNASAIYKSKLLSTEPIKTDLTRVYTGRLARALTNNLTRDFEAKNNNGIAPYPIQSNFLSPLIQSFIAQNKFEDLAYWSGQPSEVLKHESTERLFNSLVEEAARLVED